MAPPSITIRILGRVGIENIESIDLAINCVPVTLGRLAIDSVGVIPHCCVGKDDNTISKRHIKLFWDEKAKGFKILCLGKNGIIVDGKLCRATETALFTSKSAVRMGSAKFYILLPQQQKNFASKESRIQQPSYAEMLDAAYNSLDSGLPDIGVTQKDVVEWIMNTYPTYCEESKRNNLAQGIYVALNKNYERVPQPGNERSKGLKWRKRSVSPKTDVKEYDGDLSEEQASKRQK